LTEVRKRLDVSGGSLSRLPSPAHLSSINRNHILKTDGQRIQVTRDGSGGKQAGGICKALRWKNMCVHSLHDLNAAFHKENYFKIQQH
jgi:hypothetical protein